jgi:hypothetical protein
MHPESLVNEGERLGVGTEGAIFGITISKIFVEGYRSSWSIQVDNFGVHERKEFAINKSIDLLSRSSKD